MWGRGGRAQPATGRAPAAPRSMRPIGTPSRPPWPRRARPTGAASPATNMPSGSADKPPTTRGPCRPTRTLSPRRRHAQHACSWGHRPPLLPTPRRVRTRGSPAANRKEPATALLLKQARCDASPPHPRQSGAVPCTEGDLDATVGHWGAGAAVVVGRQRPGARGTARAHAPAKRRFGRNCRVFGYRSWETRRTITTHKTKQKPPR